MTSRQEQVWVVSLTRKPWAGWPTDLTPVAEVERHDVYHYPLRAHYPRTPPALIGFRYDGRLQSVHRVERDEIVDSPFGHVPGAPNEKWDDLHVLLHLGPSIGPDRLIRTGRGLYGPGRHWADLDLLLTSKTVADAVSASSVRHRSG